jgi:hypothetical protein
MDPCKHDWHFVEGTERLRCGRCGQEVGPWTTEQLTMANAPLYTFHDPRPSTITFFGMKDNDNIEVMRLSRDGVWVNPDVSCDEAAKKVLEALDNNLKLMMSKERERELDACCELLEGMHAATTGSHNYYLHAAVELRRLRKGTP